MANDYLSFFILVVLVDYLFANILHFSFYFTNIQFMNHFAGLPTANELSGTSFVTTDPAPITQPLPMIPGHITVLPPIQQSSPMVMGKAL
jgi:hypothetical protein